MATCGKKTTGSKVASTAGKILQSPKSSSAVKAVAASALLQKYGNKK